jgi:NAD(P)H dehydrogenase (quinone)
MIRELQNYWACCCLLTTRALSAWGVLMAVAVLFSAGSPDARADVAALESERIIVSGASGQLGSLVVEELLARGVDPQQLILVSRTPDTLAHYAELGAATRFGDFTQPESLLTAYEGGTRMLLISISAGPSDRPQLHKNAIDAAVQLGVSYIAYTSTVDADNLDEVAQSAAMHRETENILRESGLGWTMLRNQLYADGLVGQAAGMVAEGQVLVQPDEIPTAFVTRQDCAAAAAAVLITPGHEGMIYDITGPEVILRRDIARIASQITGQAIEVIEGAGDVPQAAGAIAGFSSFDVRSDAVEALTGRAATSVEQLLQRNRDVLQAAVSTNP